MLHLLTSFGGEELEKCTKSTCKLVDKSDFNFHLLCNNVK